MADKIKVVRDFHDHLNKGRVSQAHEHLHDDHAADFSVGGPQLKKDDLHGIHHGAQDHAIQSTVHITDAKEVDGKVVVVGKSLLKLKVEEVPFKAVYEFDGDKISAVKFETDPNFQVKAFSL